MSEGKSGSAEEDHNTEYIGEREPRNIFRFISGAPISPHSKKDLESQKNKKKVATRMKELTGPHVSGDVLRTRKGSLTYRTFMIASHSANRGMEMVFLYLKGE